jgi:hypothetical protein
VRDYALAIQLIQHESTAVAGQSFEIKQKSSPSPSSSSQAGSPAKIADRAFGSGFAISFIEV